MGSRSLMLLLAALPWGLHAIKAQQASTATRNPIRKVVTMLQAMQKKVTEEGESEKELYDKFMCYCKRGSGSLGDAVGTATTKVPALKSEITMSEEQKSQLSEELKEAQTGRESAKTAMNEATAIRNKEAESFAAEKAQAEANIAAINKAVAALEGGMAGAFLQTGTAGALRKLVASSQDMFEEDRQSMLSFLSGSEGGPSSGEIVGILKQMAEEFSKGLAEATKTEDAAVESYEALVAAKKKETGVLTSAVEVKMAKEGELAVSIEQMKNDLADTEEALAADRDFLANLQKSCTKKKAQWEERVKTRAEELTALADTIKVLNDDDALDLFKKTLPSAAASFVQVKVSMAALRAQALAELRRVSSLARPNRVHLDLVSLALRGKKVGFEKVIAMVDGMVRTLKEEQSDDDEKKGYCSKQLDLTDDKKKSIEHLISDKETAIEEAEGGVASLKEEISQLEAGIKELDKEVAGATEQRKKEHAEYSEVVASDTAAKELLAFAKNRLNAFYNPKLHRPAPKRELSAEDRIAVNMGGEAPPTEAPGGIAGTGITAFTQVSSRTHRKEAPPPPPETFDAYTKKTGESQGVMAMMDLLTKDLDKEMTEAKTEEKDAQADYEALMKDSAEKRSKDLKSLAEKEATKADLDEDLEALKGDKASSKKELSATEKYLMTLHGECDWLQQYFDVRKAARADEIDALGKAKAVLSGADYSLIQTSSPGHARRAA